jgi:lysophospholipase L1-like esterase
VTQRLFYILISVIIFCCSCEKDKAIFYGDSISSSDPALIKWPDIVQEKLELGGVNYGVVGSTLVKRSGYTVPSLEDIISKDLPDFNERYRFLFIAYGTNDICLNDSVGSVDRFYYTYDKMLQLFIRAGWPPARIVVVSPYFSTLEGRKRYEVYNIDSAASQQRVIAFVAACQRVALRHNCKFINAYSAFNRADIYLTDGIHLTPYAHQIMAMHILKHL